jgi:hypothetical protein
MAVTMRSRLSQPVGGAPAWAIVLLGVVAVALVPWSIALTMQLPAHHVARHWDVAWAGFDAGMAVVLIATVVAAVRRSGWLTGLAMAAAAMLVCDAWFDVVTASRGAEQVMAAASGMLIELPLAVICVWVARNAERAGDYLEAAGRITRRRARPR